MGDGSHAEVVYLGAVAPTHNLVSVTPTLSVHANYVTGDYVGPSTAPATATGFSRLAGLGAKIDSLTVVDVSNAKVALEIWLFDAAFTAPLDSAAWTLSAADVAHCIGVIPVATTDYFASAARAVACVRNVNLEVKPVTDTSLWLAVVVRGAPTYADGDLTLRFGLTYD
jgi:hypothetical protein